MTALKRRRIHIQRRSRKIGFLGKGMSVPSHEKSEAAHALSLRIDEELLRVGDSERDRCREDVALKPGIVRRIFSKKPDVVVLPDSGECIAEILDEYRLNGHRTDRLPNTLNVTLPGFRGESIVLEMDKRGVYLSSGSLETSRSISL